MSAEKNAQQQAERPNCGSISPARAGRSFGASALLNIMLLTPFCVLINNQSLV